MWYIIDNDGDRIELELGSTDIFDYMGETIFLNEDVLFQEFTIDDAFLLAYDWFEDNEDWPQVNAYRKGMGCTIQEAFDQWLDAYIGEFDSEKAFSEHNHFYDVERLPNWIQTNIDWQGVWDSTDRHDYFESDGYYFENQ